MCEKQAEDVSGRAAIYAHTRMVSRTSATMYLRGSRLLNHVRAKTDAQEQEGQCRVVANDLLYWQERLDVVHVRSSSTTWGAERRDTMWRRIARRQAA